MIAFGIIFSIAGAWTHVAAGSEDNCKPGHAFPNASSACLACHECRQENKCPCSSFSNGSESFFCYDSHAPDLLLGHDLHNEAMHCDALTKRTIQTCAQNAVQSSVVNPLRLYSMASSVLGDAPHKLFPWLAASVAVLLAALFFVIIKQTGTVASASKSPSQTLPIARGLE